MDRININQGIVNVRFLSRGGDHLQGVTLKSPKGYVRLSDGTGVGRVNIWDEPELPRFVKHQVFCPDGELRLWNIYKATSDPDHGQADAWTNNAGMLVDQLGKYARRYRCSDGIGEFNPEDIVFEIEWQESPA